MNKTRLAIAAVAMLASLMVISLAVPHSAWRTGRSNMENLQFVKGAAAPHAAARVWIDTDVACGNGARVDPDDCLALLGIAHTDGISIAGISLVFGNASIDAVSATTSNLFMHFSAEGTLVPAVYRGAAEPGDASAALQPAVNALIGALETGPLTILALGPLTNIEAALKRRPDLARNVEALIAVMGRQIGHLFHPAEGAEGASLLGHGPLFRDFNVAQDPAAVRGVIALGVPLVMIPYEASTAVEITPQVLSDIDASGPAGHWVAEQSQEWLRYWREDIARDGFYPFDLMAVEFLHNPNAFQCAAVTAWMGWDPAFLRYVGAQPILLVSQEARQDRRNGVSTQAWYCPEFQPQGETVLNRLRERARATEQHERAAKPVADIEPAVTREFR